MGLLRQSHFLGAKIRGLRKRNGLTLQDVSTRCIQLDADSAPSVSYLSMIETGKRTPSEPLLELLGRVFRKDPRWFLDENREIDPAPLHQGGGLTGMPLEPAFLFSKDLLQTAIPELLSQTGTDGRQFAQLLIRSYQEQHRNEFPDLERAAEDIGQRRLPLSVDDLLALYEHLRLKVRWFDQPPSDPSELRGPTVLRSFYDAPDTVYLNNLLKAQPARLKYDLASHLGHRILHNGDGGKSPHVSGFQANDAGGDELRTLGGMDSQDVLYAWRDFECSFFAGALLCPRMPFRRQLMREGYDLSLGTRLELTPAVIMRRMTVVSPYRHWHYFDAYPPGYLRAVYRGNGIPLPWGNMTMVTDPCPKWAVFDLLRQSKTTKPISQLSVLQQPDQALLYCCHSLRVTDLAGNPHVLSVGIDLGPALASQGWPAQEIATELAAACRDGGGQANVSAEQKEAISQTAGVLNISWLDKALDRPAKIICPRSTACPRPNRCDNRRAIPRGKGMDALKETIRGTAQRPC